ncbi:MAG: ATP-binding cassette domain-containing protein [Longicatena sp.]
MKEKMIEVQGLKKSFKQLEVLKDVHFDVKRGEVFALLGSNGAGKTTLIKILSTLLSADGGKAVVCGYDVTRDAMKVKEVISLTGQFSAVDEVLTGRENLTLIARLRHIQNVKEQVESLLMRFQLMDAADRRASTYSGGMKRRLDIAMSLLGDPEVIFLDEPTTGLDPEARMDVYKEIKEMSDKGVTVFLTTQYLEEAEQLADRIAILHEGRILLCGTLDELKKQLPQAKVEYVVKQPSLEDIFLSVIKAKESK